jgi:hypothetical protein
MAVVPDEVIGDRGRRRKTVEYGRVDRIDANVFLSRASSFAWRRNEVGTLEYETVVDGLRLYPAIGGGDDLRMPNEGAAARGDPRSSASGWPGRKATCGQPSFAARA